jgi:hypothetical protein
VLEAFSTLMVCLSVTSAIFPKRFHKQANEAVKELYKVDKKVFNDALTAVKEAVAKTQTVIETSASSSPSPVLSLPSEGSVASSCLPESEIRAILAQINQNVTTARKVALQRLLECVKDRNRTIQGIKI